MVNRDESGDTVVFDLLWGGNPARILIYAGQRLNLEAGDLSGRPAALNPLISMLDVWRDNDWTFTIQQSSGEKWLLDLHNTVDSGNLALESVGESAEIMIVEGFTGKLDDAQELYTPFGAAFVIAASAMDLIRRNVEDQGITQAYVFISLSVCEADDDPEILAACLVDAFKKLVRLLEAPKSDGDSPLLELVITISLPGRLTEAMHAAVDRYFESGVALSLLEAKTEELAALLPAVDGERALQPNAMRIDVSSFAETFAGLSSAIEAQRTTAERTLTEVTHINRNLERETHQMAFLWSALAEYLPTRRKAKARQQLESGIKYWQDIPEAARARLIAARFLTSEVSLNSSETSPNILAAIGAAAEIVGRSIPGTGVAAGLGVIISRATRLRIAGSEFERLPEVLNELKDLRDAAVHQRRPMIRVDVERAWAIAIGSNDEPGCFDLLVQFAAWPSRLLGPRPVVSRS